MSSYELQLRAQAACRESMLGTPVIQAAYHWDVSRSYVRRRIAGTPTRKEANEASQVLAPRLEDKLTAWAIGQARLGFAPALVKFRYMAQQMIKASGSDHIIRKAWHQRFLARNPSIHSARTKIIDYNRVNGATTLNIKLFFDRLDAPELANIPPDRYFNADEMGIGQGVGGDHWVITEAANHVALKKDVEKGEWITSFECVSGEGVILPPLLIFRGVKVQSQWFRDWNLRKYNDWRFFCSPKGWTSNATALDWVQDIFIPHIRRHHGNTWVVLVYNGHNSHTNDEFLWLCITNKIWLVFYEPHCSHVVQPLDVGVFGIVKKRLRLRVRESGSAVLGVKPSKKEVIEALYAAREETMKRTTIKSAWATSGILPRDPSRPLASRFVMLEERGVARAPARAPTKENTPKSPDFLSLLHPQAVITPVGGQDLLRKSQKLARTLPAFQDPTTRLFNRKTSKALNDLTAKAADLEAQLAYANATIARLRKPKRQAVKIAPGQRFVRMADIRRAKRRLRSRVVFQDEARDCDVPGKGTELPEDFEEDFTEIEDCIEIAGTR